MFLFNKKKKQITQVADAVAPLQQIVEDLQEVANFQHQSVESKERLIQSLEEQKVENQREADLADEQVGKMSKFFGIYYDYI